MSSTKKRWLCWVCVYGTLMMMMMTNRTNPFSGKSIKIHAHTHTHNIRLFVVRARQRHTFTIKTKKNILDYFFLTVRSIFSHRKTCRELKILFCTRRREAEAAIRTHARRWIGPLPSSLSSSCTCV